MPSIINEANLDMCKYKLFVCGKSGVGKTSTVCKLSGNEVPTNHTETPGIQTSVIYWPIKLLHREQVVVVQLELWDAGDAALRKFDHILPACKEQMDGVIYVFSFTDRNSFLELPALMKRITNTNATGKSADTGTPAASVTASSTTDQNVNNMPPMCQLVLGTKSDQVAHVDISEDELEEFEQEHVGSGVSRILRINNILGHRMWSQQELQVNTDVTPLLNTICEHLLYRERVLATTAATAST